MELSQRWTELFAEGDIARGEAYYFDGAVHELRVTQDGWKAKVLGSTTYTTVIPGDASKIGQMTCDCPRFENGYFCKHLAATCIAIEEEGDSAQNEASSAACIEELVAATAEKDVRAFLARVLAHNESLALEFVQRFGAIDKRQSCKSMARQIENAVWNYADRGFIGWRDALDFERKYLEILHSCIDPVVERSAYDVAVELSIQALYSLQPIEIDDSDGFYSNVIADVEEMWKSWLAREDDECDQLLFRAITAYLQNEPDDEQEYEIHSYGADMARDFQIEHFADKPSYAKEFLSSANERLKAAQRSLEKGEQALEHARKKNEAEASKSRSAAWRPTNAYGQRQEESSLRYRIHGAQREVERWTLIRLRALRALGEDDGSLLEEAGSVIRCERVCWFFVDSALRRGDNDQALRLLLDCKAYERDRSEGFYPIAVSRQIACLSEGRDVEAFRSEVLYMLSHATRADVQENVSDLWAWLRKSFDETAWLAQRDALLGSVKNTSTRMTCIAAEGLYERLMGEAEEAGLGALRYFERELVERYPDRVLKIHVDDLQKFMANPGSDRKAYQQLARRLCHIKGLPGGEEPVRRFVRDVCQEFPRRRALIEEMSRV